MKKISLSKNDEIIFVFNEKYYKILIKKRNLKDSGGFYTAGGTRIDFGEIEEALKNVDWIEQAEQYDAIKRSFFY